ncbi:MAG: cytochrome c biogenesis protein CcdA [Bryobacteraceae bacterium]
MRFVATCFLALASAFAQGQQHAAWTLQLDPAPAPPGSVVRIRAAARIDSGWHLYSASSAAGIPATFQVSPGALLRVLQTAPKRVFDATLSAEAEFYEADEVFLLDVKLPAGAAAGPATLSVNVRYQTCNDTTCVPGKWAGTAAIIIDSAAAAPTLAIPAGYSEAHAPQPSSAAAPPPASEGWGAFLLVAFGLGLACIFTPCVFPMIPITMSYFLNRPSGGKRDAVTQALVFCLGIVVLFSALGLLATLLLGPVGVKQLGSSPWVNGFITLLFIAFSLSLLGAFEITIPSSILTRLNQSSGQGGFAGTLLMGLTFSLSSFACVGPFVGSLLAASVTQGRARPTFGMVAFAAGLALPFFFLALFPSYLKRLPRSGGWLARVKVVMGFVILAASLVYLAKLDQVLQWSFLTRGRFLAAWIVLFVMAGLYLLGFLRLEGVKHGENTGLGRLLTGMLFLIFAVSLWPGMSGDKLGWIDAFVPASAAASAAPSDGLVWMKDQYREALDRARRENKLVFVDFTGYACTNCHWMRANILALPEIAAVLKNFVLVELYTDGADAASQANSKLQLEKFNTVAEPYYVILDPNERLVAKFEGLTRDPAQFLAFLNQAQVTPVASASAAGDYPQVTLLAGGPLSTASLSGKVVVVNFWATYCIPCIGEFPFFNKLYHQFSSQGVAFIGVAMDDDAAARVPAFLKKHPIDYTVALGSDAIMSQYKLDALPVTLIYSQSGKPVKRFDGAITEPELLAAIQQAR